VKAQRQRPNEDEDEAATVKAQRQRPNEEEDEAATAVAIQRNAA
jgi:hypothetical protein